MLFRYINRKLTRKKKINRATSFKVFQCDSDLDTRFTFAETHKKDRAD